jgi:hypothetical protein
MRISDSQLFTCIQTLPENYLVQGTSTPTSTNLSWNLSSCSQVTQFATIFDQYRIEQVEVIFRPEFNAQPMQASTFVTPLLRVVVDYDDTSAANLTQLEAYNNCNISMFETVSVTFVPHVAIAGAYGGTFSQYQNATAPWFDTASDDTSHYGVKCGCDAAGSGQTVFQSWIITTRLRISFKNVR